MTTKNQNQKQSGKPNQACRVQIRRKGLRARFLIWNKALKKMFMTNLHWTVL